MERILNDQISYDLADPYDASGKTTDSDQCIVGVNIPTEHNVLATREAKAVKNLPLWSFVSFLLGEGVQLSDWHNSYVAVVLWVVAGALGLYALWEWASLPLAAKFKVSGLRALSFGRMMPLPDASRMVYDALRGTAIRKFIDRNFDGVDPKLRVVASYVAGTSFPLFGREPAGAEPVPFEKRILKTGAFHAAGSEFRQHGNQQPVYVDVSIRRGDLRGAIRELKALSSQIPDQEGYI